MSQRDGKRAFSKAFQPMCDDPYRKALRSVAASSAASSPQIFYSPTASFDIDKENVAPFAQGKKACVGVIDEGKLEVAPHVHQAQMRLPLNTQRLQDLPEVKHAGGDIDERNYTTAQNQPSSDIDSSPSDFAPDLNAISSHGQNSGPHPDVVIFEDANTATYNGFDKAGPLTPSALEFEDLSLQNVPKRPLHILPSRALVGVQRASVFVMKSSVFEGCIPNLLPNEVIIIFNKGKQILKMDQQHLIHGSPFFAQMLARPFIKQGATRCIRLRDDFPYAIAAMMHFLQSAIYTFDPHMRTQYPNITLLDLHIQAYIVGSKYMIPTLCTHAIAEYINIGTMILSMGITPDVTTTNNNNNNNNNNDMETCLSFTGPTFSTPAPEPKNPASAVLHSFLDSLVLLWRNTPHGEDELRMATLELLKPYLNQLLRVRFFQTLMMQMVGFGDDVVQSLGEDGFEVEAFPVWGQGGVAFGGT